MAKRKQNTRGDYSFDDDDMRAISDIGNDLSNTFKDVVKAADALKKSIGHDLFNTRVVDNYIETLDDLTEEYKSTMSSLSGLDDAIQKQMQNRLTMHTELAKMMKEDIDFTLKGHDAAQAFKTPFLDIFDDFSDSVKKIPFVGNILYDRLGIDELKTELTNNLRDVFSEAAVDGQVSMEGVTKAITSTFQAMASVVTGIMKTIFLNPWLLAIVGIVLFAKKFSDLLGASEDFRKESGTTLGQTENLTDEIAHSAMGARRFGVELADAYASATALTKEFGNANLVSAKMATHLATISKLTGVSDEAAAGVYSQFLGFSDASEAGAKGLLNTLAYASELAGIPIASTFEDVAQSSEFISTYMGGAGKEIAKAAIQSKLLGLNLSQVEKITDNIMDFESSIEKELQASILLGRQLDFNRARQLAFNGDVYGATKEVVRQLGSLEEFNKLNPIQRKALADATGLTTDEIKKAIVQQKMINSLTGEERKKMEDAIKLLHGKQDVGDDVIKQQIVQESQLKQISNLFGQIGASLTSFILPVVEVVAEILGGIVWLVQGIFDFFDNIFGTSVSWLSTILKALTAIGIISATLIIVRGTLGGITGLFSKIGGVFGGIGAKGGGIFGGLGKGLSSFMTSLGSINPVTLLKAGLALAIMAGTLLLLGIALKEFQGLEWNTLAMAGAALLGLVVAFGIMGAIAFAVGPMIIVGALAIAIMAGSLLVLGIALQQFIPVMDVLERLSNVDPLNLFGAAAGIYAIGLALASFGTGAALAGIGSFFGGLLGSDPVEQLERLAALGTGLTATAVALKSIQAVMGEGINLEGISNLPDEITIPTAISAQMVDAITQSNSAVIDKMEQMIIAVKSLDLDVYLDGKKMNTSLAKGTSVAKLA